MNELAPSMLAFQQFSIPLFLIAALLAAIAGISLFIRYRTLLANWGGMFLLANTMYLASYYLLLTSASPDAIQFWFRIHSVAYLCLVMTWIFFVFVFTGHSNWSTCAM